MKVAALTPQQVVTFAEQLRTEKTSTGRQGLSPRSRQLAVGVLKSACAWAVENGLIGRNPIAGVRRPSGKSKAMSPWTAEQAARSSTPPGTIGSRRHGRCFSPVGFDAARCAACGGET